VKHGWLMSTLQDTCDMYQPTTITSKELVADGPYPVYGANGVIGRYDRFNHEESQLLVTCRGATCGSVNISEPRAWITGNSMVIRPKTPAIRIRFLEYFFRGGVDLSPAITGAAQPQITRANLNPIAICYPTSIQEQHRIVALLDEAFEGIATAKANAEKNLLNARELAEVLVEECFDRHADESFVPQALNDVCELIVDCEHKTAPIQGEGYPSIRTPNIGKGHLILNGVNRVSDQTYVEWTRRAVPSPGDLILAREAPAGNVAVIPDGVKVCLGQRTVLIRPRIELIAPRYLSHLLLQRRSQLRLLAHSRGATVQHINMKDIRAFKISCVPSLRTQQRVIEKLAGIEFDCLELEEAQLQKIAALEELKNPCSS
jgi:type I restriction enzyme, S subunit